MKHLRHIISAIKTVTSAPVYSDNVPENQGATAIAVINLGSTTNRLRISGQASGKSSVWRATVVSKDDAELESVIEQVESLDNKSNTGFQKLFIEQTVLEPKQFSEPFRRAFITIRAYN